MLRSVLAALLKRFHKEDHGAITVDWIAITAAIVMLGIAASFYVASSVPEVADSVVGYMDSVTVVPD